MTRTPNTPARVNRVRMWFCFRYWRLCADDRCLCRISPKLCGWFESRILAPHKATRIVTRTPNIPAGANRVPPLPETTLPHNYVDRFFGTPWTAVPGTPEAAGPPGSLRRWWAKRKATQ